MLAEFGECSWEELPHSPKTQFAKEPLQGKHLLAEVFMQHPPKMSPLLVYSGANWLKDLVSKY